MAYGIWRVAAKRALSRVIRFLTVSHVTTRHETYGLLYDL
jgi:hypothetical protein